MKILLISDVYFPRINGVSTSIQTFAEELQALGHTVHLIAPAYPAEWEDRLPTWRIRSRYLPFDPEDRLMHGREVKALLPVLRDEDYDLIHIQTPFQAHYLGLWLARRLGVPTVETYHTFFEEYLHLYLPLLPAFMARAAARWFSRSQCNAVDTVVVPSGPIRSALAAYGVRQPLTILPTGICPERFATGVGRRFRATHGIADETPILLTVGRVAFEKNIDFLVRMFRQVLVSRPDALLIIAGEGPALPSLQRQISDLGLVPQVRLVGYLERQQALVDCYAAADVFVFASRTETQGLVLLEAMAAGTAVVSTAELGVKDVLVDGEGALIAPEDETVFAAKVLGLLEDADARLTLAARGLAYVAKWSAPAMAGRLATLYRTLLTKRAPPDLDPQRLPPTESAQEAAPH